MNTELNGSVVLNFGVCGVDGNPHHVRVGSRNPMGLYDKDNTETVADISLEATYHGDRDEFHVVATYTDDSKVYHNIKSLDYFKLATTHNTEGE